MMFRVGKATVTGNIMTNHDTGSTAVRLVMLPETLQQRRAALTGNILRQTLLPLRDACWPFITFLSADLPSQTPSAFNLSKPLRGVLTPPTPLSSFAATPLVERGEPE